MVTEQIPLRFAWRDGLSFNNFFPAKNGEAVHYLQQAACGASGAEQFLFLWGASSVGKSHLLQAACQLAAEHQRSVAYLPMMELVDLSPEIFDGLEKMSLVCVDDVQCIAGESEWEKGLFYFYNRVRDAGGVLLVAANVAPAALNIGLPDLHSRLGWGPVFHLAELDDVGKIAALQLRAKRRGFDLPGRGNN